MYSGHVEWGGITPGPKECLVGGQCFEALGAALKPKYAWVRWDSIVEPGYLVEALVQWDVSGAYGDHGWRAVYDFSPSPGGTNYMYYKTTTSGFVSSEWYLVHLEEL